MQDARRRRESGFTLIELLIVVAIIAIIAAIAIVALQNALDKAKQRGTMADMRTIAMALETYATDVDRYPSNGLTMAQLVTVLVPYQVSVLRTEDHWKNQYLYEFDGTTTYSIESFGKDGINGLEISHATRFEFDRDLVLSNGFFVASPDT